MKLEAQVVAVSPIVGDRRCRGPAGILMAAQGLPVSIAGVAQAYQDFLDVLIVDTSAIRQAAKELAQSWPARTLHEHHHAHAEDKAESGEDRTVSTCGQNDAYAERNTHDSDSGEESGQCQTAAGIAARSADAHRAGRGDASRMCLRPYCRGPSRPEVESRNQRPFRHRLARTFNFEVIPDNANRSETDAIEMATQFCEQRGVRTRW